MVEALGTVKEITRIVASTVDQQGGSLENVNDRRRQNRGRILDAVRCTHMSADSDSLFRGSSGDWKATKTIVTYIAVWSNGYAIAANHLNKWTGMW